MVEYGGSDLFITADFPPSIKLQGFNASSGSANFNSRKTKFCHSLMNETTPWNLKMSGNVICHQCSRTFHVSVSMCLNSNYNWHGDSNHRLRNSNLSKKLKLPESLKNVMLEKRGLVLVVGSTGSGKSTSLAAMIDYRNENSAGHIITVEDPWNMSISIKKSMVTHAVKSELTATLGTMP